MRYAATIGFFDGVHRGHQYVISRLRADAAEHGLGSAVVTFRQHPRQVLQKDFIPKLLTPCEDKLQLLRQTGVDRVFDLDFTLSLASLTAREFMSYLHDELCISRLLIGYDNRFGRNREDGFEQYQQYGREIGIEVVCNDVFTAEGVQVSSSVVRRFLSEGSIAEANLCLGRNYGFAGTVVRGFGEGRKLGFPTANMSISPDQLVPRRGVYAVKVGVEGFDSEFLGMMNIGCRPTYGEFAETQEVNILDFDSDIYDRQISVQFLSRLRDEKKFTSIDQLRQQLHTDQQAVAAIRKQIIEPHI